MVLKRLALNWDHHDASANSVGECCLRPRSYTAVAPQGPINFAFEKSCFS